MATTFKAFSALLSYPSAELQAATGDIEAAIRADNLVAPEMHDALAQFLSDLQSADLLDLQERYVDLFDKTRRLSLHLFEHVHGESRDRGQAMVDLASLYEQGGLTLSASELPDYLPLFLEYLSTRPLEEARALLDDTAHILATLQGNLERRGSPYAALFASLRSIIGGETIKPSAETQDEAPLDDLAALDAAWEETVVTFGPGDAMSGCSVDRLRVQVRAGRRDARKPAA